VYADPQVFNLADGVKVTVEYPADCMPEWEAKHNALVILTGSAKEGGVGMGSGLLGRVSAAGYLVPPTQPTGAEESRTNIRNTVGMNMTRGTMDPADALNKGIPGLTAGLAEKVHRTLDSAEESAAAQLDQILEDDSDLAPEEEIVVPDA